MGKTRPLSTLAVAFLRHIGPYPPARPHDPLGALAPRRRRRILCRRTPSEWSGTPPVEGCPVRRRVVYSRPPPGGARQGVWWHERPRRV